jgi:catechol 2,3-dioxygenase-like lactoylglutathione lyase family enzyme
VPQLDAIGIVVRDPEESARFYRTLGLEMPEPGGHWEVAFPSGFRLMFDTEDVIRSFEPEWRREAGSTIAIAFACASPAEVDEVYRRVVDAGFPSRKEPWDASWGYRYAQVFDPDGTPVDLFAAL